jgi:hypothetical protein
MQSSIFGDLYRILGYNYLCVQYCFYELNSHNISIFLNYADCDLTSELSRPARAICNLAIG